MNSFLSRLFGRARSPDASAAARPIPARPNVEPTPALAPVSTFAPAEAIVGSRRPLLDREGRLAGFEFRLPAALAQRLERQGDAAAQAAHAAALLASMRVSLAAHRVALLALPLAIASRPSVLAQVPEGAMLALTDAPGSTPEAQSALAVLRQTGAHLGTLGAPMSGGQFVLLDGASQDIDTLARVAQACRAAAPGVRVIATGLASIDDLEAALTRGIDLAAGNLDRTTAPRQSGLLPPRLQRLCQLLNQVVRDADLAALAAELRTDVDLSYRLLRHANSPLLGLSRPAESVEQAVMLLGRDGLYRWLTILLLTGAEGRPSSRALQGVALARARLLEKLAPQLGAPSQALFTTGMLSLLDVMLRVPMDDVLRPLNLPEPAVQALMGHDGPWWPALALAQSLERSDLDTAETLADRFGGLDRVHVEAEAAWRWVAEATADRRP